MNLRLDDRTALVLGASRGIGRACADSLASSGAHVVVTGSDLARAEAASEGIRAAGGSAEAAVVDVRSAAGVEESVGALVTRLGAIHVLVTNGPGPAGMPARDVPLRAVEDALVANLVSGIAACRAVLPGMVDTGYGRIVQLASTTAKEPDEGMVLSNVSRAAATAWGKTLSREVASHGVTVNTVLIGSALSERTIEQLRAEAESAGQTYDELLAEVNASIPAGYVAPPSQLGDVVAFLASPAAAYVNGVSIAVDGGWMRGL